MWFPDKWSIKDNKGDDWLPIDESIVESPLISIVLDDVKSIDCCRGDYSYVLMRPASRA